MPQNIAEHIEDIICIVNGVRQGYLYANGQLLDHTMVTVIPMLAASHRGLDFIAGNHPNYLNGASEEHHRQYAQLMEQAGTGTRAAVGVISGMFKHGIIQTGVGFTLGYITKYFL